MPCSLITLGGLRFSEWKQTRSGSGGGEVLRLRVETWRRGEKRYCGRDILYEKIIKRILCMKCTKVDSVPGN